MLMEAFTGITKDVESCVFLHNAGSGAKYTRGRRPVELYVVKWSATVGLLCGESVQSSGCDLLQKES